MNDAYAKEIAKALRSIASGDRSGPNGLELVATALGGDENVAQSLNNVANAIGRVADAIENLTQHMTGVKDRV